jgi:6-hydroxynicotinate 3-monooxygenase
VAEPVDAWSKGRLVLLGGTPANAMMPYMASGAAMAMEDAAVLARCLVQADDHPAAFGLYQTSRMSRVTKVQRISAENSFLRRPSCGSQT